MSAPQPARFISPVSVLAILLAPASLPVNGASPQEPGTPSIEQLEKELKQREDAKASEGRARQTAASAAAAERQRKAEREEQLVRDELRRAIDLPDAEDGLKALRKLRLAHPSFTALIDPEITALEAVASRATQRNESVSPAMNSVSPATNNQQASNPSRCRVELAGSRKPRCWDLLSVGGNGQWLSVLSAGSFQMGNNELSLEGPVHWVTIGKPFAMSEHEVSQGEYRQFCSETRRACEAQPWNGDDYPVVRVSWQDARDYAAWLSVVTGARYRLPTEAEWEFAAGAGVTGRQLISATDVHFAGITKPNSPATRGEMFNPNRFRLYHMIGNVREWVEDSWNPGYVGAPADGSARRDGTALRTARGGAFTDSAAKLRVTTREGLDGSTRDNITGFRVVRELN